MSTTTKKLFENITDESFLGIIVFKRPNYDCEYMNRVAREYLEITDSDISKFRFENMIPQDNNSADRFRPFSKDFFEQPGLSQDVIIKKLSDRSFIADVGVRIIESEGQSLAVLMLRDVTLQKKMQRDLTTKQNEIQKAFQEILEQNKALKELDRAKDKFVALTTHELRTPLSAMIATAEVLVMKLYDTDEQRDGFIKTIHEEGLHLLEIVNDILDFAKIQAGKMDFYIEEQNVSDLIEKECSNFEKMAEAKGVKIDLQFEDKSALAYYDALRFRQCFDNVLNNAIKFTKEKTVVTVSVKKDNEFLKISILDKGPGIPPQAVTKVFNEFETVGNVNTHHKGTGLGMPITKRLLENMGGRIELESEVGKGACFSLFLPTTKILNEELYRSRPIHTDDLAA